MRVLALILLWLAPAWGQDCYELASEAAERGDWIRARRFCQLGIVEPPPQSSRYLAEALRAMEDGELERATLWLQSAILISPRDPELWRMLEQAIKTSQLYDANDEWLIEMMDRRGGRDPRPR